MRRQGVWAALIAVVFGVTACSGYQWVGPGTARLDGYLIVMNETREPFLSGVVTRAIAEYPFLPAGRPSLVRIVAFTDTVLAFAADDRPSHRRVSLTLRYRMPEREGDLSVTRTSTYPVTGDSTRNRDAKDRAAEDAAHALVAAMALGVLEGATDAAGSSEPGDAP